MSATIRRRSIMTATVWCMARVFKQLIVLCIILLYTQQFALKWGSLFPLFLNACLLVRHYMMVSDQEVFYRLYYLHNLEFTLHVIIQGEMLQECSLNKQSACALQLPLSRCSQHARGHEINFKPRETSGYLCYYYSIRC